MTCTFRHALRAAYRTAISAAQILVITQIACTAICKDWEQRLQSTVKLRVRSENLRYPLSVSDLAGTGTEPDSEKWPDIRPTGTGYPVHPYRPDSLPYLTIRGRRFTIDQSHQTHAGATGNRTTVHYVKLQNRQQQKIGRFMYRSVFYTLL